MLAQRHVRPGEKALLTVGLAAAIQQRQGAGSALALPCPAFAHGRCQRVQPLMSAVAPEEVAQVVVGLCGARGVAPVSGCSTSGGSGEQVQDMTGLHWEAAAPVICTCRYVPGYVLEDSPNNDSELHPKEDPWAGIMSLPLAGIRSSRVPGTLPLGCVLDPTFGVTACRA